MPFYTLSVKYPNRDLAVTKYLRSDKEAKFWAQLCLDICGKNEHGEKYLSASVADKNGKVLQTYPIVKTK